MIEEGSSAKEKNDNFCGKGFNDGIKFVFKSILCYLDKIALFMFMPIFCTQLNFNERCNARFLNSKSGIANRKIYFIAVISIMNVGFVMGVERNNGY